MKKDDEIRMKRILENIINDIENKQEMTRKKEALKILKLNKWEQTNNTKKWNHNIYCKTCKINPRVISITCQNQSLWN